MFPDCFYMNKVFSSKFGMGALALLLAAVFSNRVSAASNEDEIRSLITHYYSAINAMDVGSAMKYYGPSKTLLVYDVADAPLRGTTDVTKHWTDFFAKLKELKLEPREIEIEGTSGGKIAFSHFIERATIVTKDGRRFVEDNLRTTQIYQKIGARWLIVHEHKSKSRRVD